MTTSSQTTEPPRSMMWLLCAVVGGVIGWAVGFFGFAIHCAVFIPGPIPVGADGPVKGAHVTAYTQIYGWTIREETGPFGEVLDSGSRRTDVIAWPVVAVCIVAGTLIGVWLWWIARLRKQSSEPHKALE